MKNVLIVYRILPHYRIEFYNGLREALLKENVMLHLVYGKGTQMDTLKNDQVDIEWATFIPNKIYRFYKFEIIVQPCFSYLKNKDMIIVEGANRLLLNYYLMLIRPFSRFKLGVWGHGRNLQIAKDSKRNKFKNLFLRNCDWYFAYTQSVRDFLIKQRFNPDRITIVQNAIDTVALKDSYAKLDPAMIDRLADELGVKGKTVGLYCGSMYPDKRMDFVLDACHRIRAEIPDFHMLFIGNGVDSKLIIEDAEKNNWIHYIGARNGDDRIPYFRLATVQIMPYAVGLSVLDSFAMETPLITTDSPFHGPEIDYLENGINGIITEADMEIYSREVINIIKTGMVKTLTENCKKSATYYTMDRMIENFKNGILSNINS